MFPPNTLTALEGIVTYHVDLVSLLLDLHGEAAGLRADASLATARLSEYEQDCRAEMNRICDRISSQNEMEDEKKDELLLDSMSRQAEREVYQQCQAKAKSSAYGFGEEVGAGLSRVGELSDALLERTGRSLTRRRVFSSAQKSRTRLDIVSESSSDEGEDDSPAQQWGVAMKRYFASYFTLGKWYKEYQLRKWWREDVAAGLTVSFMLIPQGMAYSLLAGLPPIHGLYASIFPLLLYPFFGTSKEISQGPTAISAILTPNAIHGFAPLFSPAYVMVAHIVAFLTGVVLTIVGLARASLFIESLLSRPVLHGFTNGAAIVIMISQAKAFFGFLDYPRTTSLHGVLYEVFTRLDRIHWWTVLYSVVCLLLSIGLKKWNRRFPASFAVLVLATLVSFLADASSTIGIAIVGEVPYGLPGPILFEGLDFAQLLSMIPAVGEVALIVAIENLTIAKTLSSRRKYTVGPNQELFAAGLSNMLTAVFQGFPVAGSFSRSAVNYSSGSHSPFNNWMAGVGVILSLVVLTPVFRFIPNAVLASIIIESAFKLIDFKDVKELWTFHRGDLLQLVACFLATVFLGPELGILLAIVVSLAQVLYRAARPPVFELARLSGTTSYHHVRDYPDQAVVIPHVIVVRHTSRLFFFANISYFITTITSLVNERWPEVDPSPEQAKAEGDQGHATDRSCWARCKGKGDPAKRTEGDGSEPAGSSPAKVEAMEMQSVLPTPAPGAPSGDGTVAMEPTIQKSVVVDGGKIITIDVTAVHQIIQLAETLRKRGVQMLFGNVSPATRQLMETLGLIKALDAASIFHSLHGAVEFAAKVVFRVLIVDACEEWTGGNRVPLSAPTTVQKESLSQRMMKRWKAGAGASTDEVTANDADGHDDAPAGPIALPAADASKKERPGETS